MKSFDLLSRGYFPKELPPPFGSTSFARAIQALSAAPGMLEFLGTTKLPKKWSRKIRSAKPVPYSHARSGLLRRQLSIPNPILHALLCAEVEASWAAIAPCLQGSPIAATAPIASARGRAVVGKHRLADRSNLAARTRTNCRFVLQTDIARFYHSIYTHSIPWAVMGKATAKVTRDFKSDCGNRLDFWVRNGQDQQTVGIPIGPDTSLVLAELIMHKVDADLKRLVPQVQGHRYLDDYELGFQDRTAAEDTYHHLETVLGRFELALNPRKTEIKALPERLEPRWVAELRTLRISDSSASVQAHHLQRYFDLAYELQKSFPGEHVLPYAAGRLRYVKMHKENWEQFQRWAFLFVSPEPGALSHVLDVLVTHMKAGHSPDKALVEQIANTLIQRHARLPHTSEVAWSIWALIVMGLKLERASVEQLEGNENSVIALLALDAESRGLTAKKLDTTAWRKSLTGEGLYDEQWLLAYEAACQGWLQSHTGADHIGSDPAFDMLRKANVRFYEPARLPSKQPLPTPPPHSATKFLVNSGTGAASG